MEGRKKRRVMLMLLKHVFEMTMKKNDAGFGVDYDTCPIMEMMKQH